MSSLSQQTQTYCAPCDLYFPSLSQRATHIQESLAHPECTYCKRRFLNKNTLRNHYIYSRFHHYCASCEVEFASSAGLRYHLEHAPVHCDDSDDEQGLDGTTPAYEWEEEMGQREYPEEQVVVSNGAESDNSWEEFDDYDYEDAEELKPTVGDEENEEEDDDDGVDADFICPICCNVSESVCCPPCGHLFCSGCIAQSLKTTRACPICLAPSTVSQLRKVFIA
ncbi:RING-type domain-containing protein [Mycena kentingensis (nom. inval.)]|nr:RING-type domain-containing protein [Mycena kentingensis (nom. inval.)]